MKSSIRRKFRGDAPEKEIPVIGPYGVRRLLANIALCPTSNDIQNAGFWLDKWHGERCPEWIEREITYDQYARSA